MIRSILLLAFLGIISTKPEAQIFYKYDNTVYNAVFLNEAFKLMSANPDHLLLDVRSPGEYADTSSATALNIGRFKGAVNINISDVPAHLEELKKYIDKPVFVYCSHSQRSRRVSKLLVENGFKKVYNINGGMSLVNESDSRSFTDKYKVLETNTNYKNIASAEAINLLTSNPELLIIDIRTENEFNSKDSIQRNNIGRLKNAINIPQDVFKERIASMNLSGSRPVLLYDLHGNNSMDVVDFLRAKGFTQVYNLFEGLVAFACDNKLTPDLRKKLLDGSPGYQFLNPKGCIDLLVNSPGTLVLDTRPFNDFENKASREYMNLGRIKGAIHVGGVDSLPAVIQQMNKTAPILVYGGSENTGVSVSNELLKKGFSTVYYLYEGLYRFVWATANIEDCKQGRQLLTNHEGLY